MEQRRTGRMHAATDRRAMMLAQVAAAAGGCAASPQFVSVESDEQLDI